MSTPEKKDDTALVAAQRDALALLKDETVNMVMAQVSALQSQGRIRFPPNYSPENALMSAYLALKQAVNKDKRPVLEVCTKESVANSLLDMVVQGLNPSKKQGYFIAYGPTVVFQRSYFGTVTVTKRVTGAQEIYAEVVYANDGFKFRIDRGNTLILEHTRELKNINQQQIVAAYCTIVAPDLEQPYSQIMTIEEIHEAWRKSRNNPFDEHGRIKPDSVHGQFAQEMCKKTVTNRTCKMFVNSSMDDSLSLVVEHMNRADEIAEETEFAEQVSREANTRSVDPETGEIIDADYREAPDGQGAAQPPPETAKPEGQGKPPASKHPKPDF